MTKEAEGNVLQWDLIRAFLALKRAGDYAVAAELEGVDDSTLRKRIRVLEQHMGRTLFVRNGRGWEVSPDEDELVRAALAMEGASRSFARTQRERAGVVRVTVLDVFAQRFAPAFALLLERHPGLSLKVTTEVHFVDLEQEQVDIAIRMACPRGDSGSLRIRKIGEVPVNAYASREYLERAGREAAAEDPVVHRLLAMDLSFPHLDHNFTYADLSWANFGIRGRVFMAADSFLLLTQLCEAGHGVAIIPAPVAEHCRNLVPIRPERPAVSTELWLVSRLDPRAEWQHDLFDLLQAELARWSARQG